MEKNVKAMQLRAVDVRVSEARGNHATCRHDVVEGVLKCRHFPKKGLPTVSERPMKDVETSGIP